MRSFIHVGETIHSRTYGAALAALILSGSAYVAAGCATGHPEYVQAGPPMPPSEVVIVQPGPEYVWVPGYYGYSNGNYVWVQGQWHVPPSGYHTWHPAQWVHEYRGWHYQPGRWVP